MLIKSIDIENWKCFSDRVSLTFSCIEIFSFPNGSGKTSVLEAIYYGLWGKTDSKLASYQNHDGQTVVEIEFEIDGCEYNIHREFPKNVAVLKKNGTSLKTGIREIYDYINSILPYDLVKRLWFKGDIAESEVLSFNFFKNEVLAEQLKTPSSLYKYYSQLWHQKCREANQINVNNSLRSLKDVDADIANLTSKLKERNTVNDMLYLKAVDAKSAHEEMQKIEDSFNSLGVNTIAKDIISRYKSIDVEALKSKLLEEESKFYDSTLSSINTAILNTIKNANNSNGKCIICDGDWSSDRRSYIESVVEKGFKSNELIERLKANISFHDSISEDLVEASSRYYSLADVYNKCTSYEDVIEAYNKRNDDLWSNLDTLKSERDLILRNEQNAQRLEEVVKEREDAKSKMTFIKDYLDKATAYYTDALLVKSNKILTRINNDYEGISVSPEDSSLKVSVRGDDLLVSQLSRGERTMVAMSLIYSIRDIFTPSMPLIFDESFASLSEENNYGVISFVKESQDQLFIITHNKSWISFNGYDKTTTNIRTAW